MNKSEISLLEQRLLVLKNQKENILKIKKSLRTTEERIDLETIQLSINNIKNWIKNG